MNELFNEKEIQKEAMEDIKKVILQLEEKEAQYARIIKDVSDLTFHFRMYPTFSP